MRPLTPAGQDLIDDIAQRHGFSVGATISMLDAVLSGNGGQAQFNHPEFSGSGQWMRGGMTMVSDLFNSELKRRVDALCTALSDVVQREPKLMRSGSFQSQSQSQGGGAGNWQIQSSGRHTQGGGYADAPAARSAASVFAPTDSASSGRWWPAGLERPDSTGSQNGSRYAYFGPARRLAIETQGRVTVYDTLDHQIGGFSQQQGRGDSMRFNSQHGLIDVARLPVIAPEAAQAAQAPTAGAPAAATPLSRPARALASEAATESTAMSAPESSAALPMANRSTASSAGGLRKDSASDPLDVFALIEKLASLHAKGILSDEEFTTKKLDFLSRI